jgi:hypothetical protein
VVGKLSPATGRALHVVDRLDQVVDAERNGGDQDDAQVLEAVERVIERRDRQREAKVRDRRGELVDAHAAPAQARRRRAPRDQRPDRDRDQPGRDAAVFHAAEPARQE